MCRYYRQKYAISVSVGILYNHESKYRKSVFLSKKIIQSVLKINANKQAKLTLGDLSAVTDWGYAPEYVNAFRKIIDCKIADDFIIATGQKHTVKEFVENTFQLFNLDWKEFVVIDSSLIQKTKRCLIGDSSKLTSKTDWKASLNFKELIIQLLLDEQNYEK